jgi:hypothetical protein
MEERKSGRADWGAAWAVPAFRRALVAGITVAVVIAIALPRFFAWIEARPGSRMHDPVLAMLGPVDLSLPTFTILYATVAVVVFTVVRDPQRLLHGLYAYLLLLLLRMVAMAVLTLEPPPGIIPLVDPVTLVFYPGGTPFLKDLFFSGHTATMTLLALLAPRGVMKWLAGIGTVAIGSFVLLQHVHWTVDVLAAVPAAWLAWFVAGRLVRGFVPAIGGAGA